MLPFIDKKLQDNRITSDSTSPHGNARIKVEQDIAFLTDRIAAMKSQPRPNAMLIEHYQSMLKSRESVLKWLMDGCDDETSCLPDQRSAG
ncbi:hypothetical protein [Cellvibrio sp. PSBB023]|uniref:hypothetical protein n=1 Tax=Cellvibrio sp. PSBB023 TaxID=1945512 RepID=UPI00098F91CD|nr:hypothetical protein [Cellvibrio sp. PSBB023]AQT61624.1 hypothetical protein B0D95_17035 [Cellvibrio sp. PSBB023]